MGVCDVRDRSNTKPGNCRITPHSYERGFVLSVSWSTLQARGLHMLTGPGDMTKNCSCYFATLFVTS